MVQKRCRQQQQQEELQHILPTPNVLTGVSNSMWAINLSSNKILQLVMRRVMVNTGCPVKW